MLWAFALLAFMFVSGCSSRQAAGLRKSMAINMGVSAKRVTIKHADLGKHFSSLKNTRYDFLSKKAPKHRRIKLSYRTFGIESVDGFNRSASVLIGQFKYTDNLINKFISDSRRLFKKDLKGLRLADVNDALRKKRVKKSKVARFYRSFRGDFRGILSNFRNVYGSIKKLRVAGARLIKVAPRELRKDPKRAIYTDAILGELKQRTQELTQLVGTGKTLASRIRKVEGVMKALDTHSKK
jgi:hypothetical protein